MSNEQPAETIELTTADKELNRSMHQLASTLRSSFAGIKPSINYMGKSRSANLPTLDYILKQFGLEGELLWKYYEPPTTMYNIRNTRFTGNNKNGKKEIDGMISTGANGTVSILSLNKADKESYGELPAAHVLRFAKIDPVAINPQVPRASGVASLSYLNNLKAGKYVVNYEAVLR